MSPDFSSIRAIFFDTTDTLYQSKEMEAEYPRQLALLIARERNISFEEAVKLLEETTEALKPTLPHVTKVRAMAELGYTRDQVHDAFFQTDPANFIMRDEELAAMLQNLSARFPLGIISNDRKRQMLRVFAALGLEEAMFSFLITDDIVQERKPDPEPFLKAIEMAGRRAEECLYVGDNPTKDMRPAKELGMMTVLVRADPKPEDLTYVDANVADVKKVLELLP